MDFGSGVTVNSNDERMLSATPLESRLLQIEADLHEIKETLWFVRDTIVKADGTITKVAGEVMPTINELTKSPLIKMLGMKK